MANNPNLPPVFMHIPDMNIDNANGNDNASVMGHGSTSFRDNDNQSMSLRQSLTWSQVNPSGDIPPARSGAASVIVGRTLYIFGGYGGGTGRLDDFYSFDFERNEWSEVQVLSDEKPGCRENNGVVASGDSSRVYIFGGYNGNHWLNDLWVFDIKSKRWECIQESSDPNVDMALLASDIHNSGTVPSRRFGYVSVVHNNKFVLFGGFDGSKWLNDMWEFSFETKRWRLIQPRGQMPSVRSCPAWCSCTDERHAGILYIIGGYDGMERKADFFACDLNTRYHREGYHHRLATSTRAVCTTTQLLFMEDILGRSDWLTCIYSTLTLECGRRLIVPMESVLVAALRWSLKCTKTVCMCFVVTTESLC